MDHDQSQSIVELTAEIVSAYVSNNEISPGEVSILITNVSIALRAAAADQRAPAKDNLKPAVPIKRSVFPDYIICLEDGKKYKSLRRHLRTRYNLTPEEYRERWGLPHSYPMVAPNYHKSRSAMAKKMGLGKRS